MTAVAYVVTGPPLHSRPMTIAIVGPAGGA
jgi:hypothetical protein